MNASDNDVDSAEAGARLNPYESRSIVEPVDKAQSSGHATAKWPTRPGTAVLAAVLSAAVNITMFVSLSASFGNAFEFFQNGGILAYAKPGSLLHVMILNTVGAFFLCYGVQTLFPNPSRVPSWLSIILLLAFSYFAATFIDEQQFVASRRVLYLTPATILAPISIWLAALIVTTWSILLYPRLADRSRQLFRARCRPLADEDA